MTAAKRPLSLEPDDLSVRVRRGDSTAEERRALERALEGSAVLRVAHELGRDFDEAARVQPGDDELIARASAGALSRGARRRGRRWAWTLGVAAALSIATAAATTGHWLPSARPTAPKEVAPRANVPNVARRGDGASPALATETQPNGKPGTETPAEPRAEAVPRPRAHESSQGSTPKTAADLFRDANAARRAGNFELARALYGELQAKFPDSDQARVSRVSLGKLLLAAGNAQNAAREFESYLASGGKSLEEEALVGRADALARLGESGEERRVWQDLLRKHPSSVYAARARQRLDELGAADHADRR